MPYLEPHWLITVSGTSYGTIETWQFGVRAFLNPDLVGTNYDTHAQNLANYLAAPTQTMHGNTNIAIGQDFKLTTIKVARIEIEGQYAPAHVPGIYSYTTPVAGSASAKVWPQLALTVSLKTDIPRGRAHAGRFFLPGCSLAPGTDGRLTDSVVNNAETVIKTWLNAINAASETTTVGVFSKLDLGYSNPVTEIGIGRVMDTQRRRRRSIVEARTFVPL